MKKYAILALAALMVAAFAIPASALENEFGGYFDTRFQATNNFDGFDTSSGDVNDDHEQVVEQRTRLFYTAKINDNLKLVNAFEMDATWGGAGTYGDVGADEVAIEVKHTYADFNTGPVRWTVGTQPYKLFRGYLINKDASGIIARWKIMDNFILAGSWLKAFEGGVGNDNDDIDSYTVTGAFYFSENMSLTPSINWTHTADATGGIGVLADDPTLAAVAVAAEGADIFSYGVDFDAAFDNFSFYFTGVLQDGDLEFVSGTGLDDVDFKGWMVAAGFDVMLGPADIYVKAAYLTGDDDPTDDEYEAFFNPNASVGWAELLGDGSLWNGSTAGIGGSRTGDVIANSYIGGGVKFTPMEKLTINPSVWYAWLDEDNQTGEDVLGTEVDLVVSYQLLEGLNLDLIGAYLFADDAFSDVAAENEDDAYEYGAVLSLSF